MAIEIYQGNTLVYTLSRTLSSTLEDKLSGERTLSFSFLSRSFNITDSMTVKLDGQYYSIVRIAKKMSGGLPATTVDCEHISYILNNEEYNLVTFVFEGTPTAGLSQLLSGTPFSPGICEATSRVEVAFTEGELNRRNALMRFIDACGCEVEYDGLNINLRTHRGSTTRKSLMDGVNVTDVSTVIDTRSQTQTYEIALFKMADLEAGDEVNITFHPMNVSVNTRIVGITYNPFYRYTVRVEVGDYAPNLLESTATKLDKIRQEFKASDGELLSYIETIDGDISTISQTADKINWLVKSGTSSSNFTLTPRMASLVSESIDLTGYVTISSLGASGTTVIDGSRITTGTISADRIDSADLHVNAANIDGTLTIGSLPESVALTDDIPTSTSQLTNDSGFQTASGITSIINGTVTTDYVNALGISVNAANITGTLTVGSIPSSIARTSQIPTSTSQLTNNSGYVTSSGVTTIIGNTVTTGYVNALGITVNAANVTGTLSANKISTGTMGKSTAQVAMSDSGTVYISAMYDTTIESTAGAAKLTAGTYSVELANWGAFIPLTNGTINLGNGNYKWNTVYAATGTINTSDRNRKTNINYDISAYDGLFDRIEPVSFLYIDGDSGRTHTGFISQDLESALIAEGMTAYDFAAFCKDEQFDGSWSYGIRYDELIPLLWRQVKLLKTRITALEGSN